LLSNFKEVRTFISSKFGSSYLPANPPKYKTKTRGAQEAHEAVRPTSVLRTPKAIKQFLTRDQYRLYQLIWQNFVASQMADAIFNTISIEIDAQGDQHQFLLRASGSTIKFAGFLVVLKDLTEKNKKGEMPVPTDLSVGQWLNLIRLLPEQHFTQPPPRFSDASLVSMLEENGIGRPSTFAPTIATLLNRNYVFREKRRLYPTETGIVVTDLLVEHFPDIVDTSFTAKMETSLDQVASGGMTWVEIIRDFYGPFSKTLELANKNMPDLNTGPEPLGRDCPDCGQGLVIRWGRHGKFIGCSNFPECRHTEALLEKIAVKCPEDGGELVRRKTRRGRVFYGCENYPSCEFSSWKLPLAAPCPKCQGLLITENKNHLACLKCGEQFLRDEILSDDVEDLIELA
jgi:DNA topoisomerase-1